MQLTKTAWDFQMFMVVLGAAYLAIAYFSEKVVFQRLVQLAGQLKERLSRQPKKRKAYKLILEQMRI